MNEEEKDLIPEDVTPKRKLRCFCGETVVETSQTGNPPKCISCPECYSTLTESRSRVEQSIQHDWQKQGPVKICRRCMREEIQERVLTDEQYQQLIEYSKEDEDGETT